jgi:transcriptional regulator with XRE-family HTH domain
MAEEDQPSVAPYAGATRAQTPAERLGQRLRQARLARNLTQGDVALNQFSVSYISAVERGQVRTTLGALERLAERLQVPIADLVREDADTAGGVGAGSGAGMAAGVTALPHAESFPLGPGLERDEVDIGLRLAEILLRQGDAEAATQVLIALRGRSLLSLREQVLVGWRLAQCAVERQQRDDLGRSRAQKALALAEQLGDPELRERVRLTLAEALLQQGAYRAVLDQLCQSREAAEGGTVLDPLFRLEMLFLLGTAEWQLGDLEAAGATLGEAAAAATDVLAPERLGALYAELFQQYRAAGDAQRARLYGAHSLATYEDAASQRLASRVLVRFGRVHAQAGQLAEAITLMERVRARAAAQEDLRTLAETLSALAGLYLQQRRIEDATRAARQAGEYATTVRDPAIEAEAELVLAHVSEVTGDERGAERQFEAAIEHLRAADAADALGEAYAQYSAFLERRGDSTKALEILKRAWRVRERR